jgi:hypothetical protein
MAGRSLNGEGDGVLRRINKLQPTSTHLQHLW